MTKQELISAWNAVTLIKIFEMPVENMDTGEKDGYIVWTITHDENGLIATASEDLRESVVRVEWDECFSLDEHLESLSEACWYAIMDDSTFTHRDEE